MAVLEVRLFVGAPHVLWETSVSVIPIAGSRFEPEFVVIETGRFVDDDVTGVETVRVGVVVTLDGA